MAALDKLTPYTQYDIQVRAYNDKGDGPWTMPLRVTTSESGKSGYFSITTLCIRFDFTR